MLRPRLSLANLSMGLTPFLGDHPFRWLFTNGEVGGVIDLSPLDMSWRRNFLTFSEDLSNANWGKSAIVPAYNATTNPDGMMTATRVTEDTSSGEHGFNAPSIVYTPGVDYTFWVVLRPSGRTRVRLLLPSAAFAFNKVGYYDLDSLEVISTSGTEVSAQVFAGIGGYVILAITARATAAAFATTGQVRLINTGTNVVYAGDGASGVDFAYAQIEAGTPTFVYQKITDLHTEVRAIYPNAYLYQDPAGLQPVTAPGQTVALAKMRPGAIDFTQANQPSRPTFAIRPHGGRRNLLVDSAFQTMPPLGVLASGDDLGPGEVYPGAGVTATLVAAGSLDGVGRSVDIRFQGTGSGSILIGFSRGGHFAATVGMQFTLSAHVALVAGTLANVTSTTIGISEYLDATWQTGSTTTFTPTGDVARVSHSTTLSDADTDRIRLSISIAVAGTVDFTLRVYGPQLERGLTLTPYQRVTTMYDVFEIPKTHYGALAFDGVDDGMVSGVVTPGTDKVQILTGLRKNSDAAIGMVLESSVNSDTNAGTFFATAPNWVSGGNYRFRSKGTALSEASSLSAFYAPISNVLIGTGDISGDAAKVFVNGAQSGATATGDQGTGNYLAYPLYMGRRAGTSLALNGELEAYVVLRLGPNLSDAQVARASAIINAKTGCYA